MKCMSFRVDIALSAFTLSNERAIEIRTAIDSFRGMPPYGNAITEVLIKQVEKEPASCTFLLYINLAEAISKDTFKKGATKFAEGLANGSHYTCH